MNNNTIAHLLYLLFGRYDWYFIKKNSSLRIWQFLQTTFTNTTFPCPEFRKKISLVHRRGNIGQFVLCSIKQNQTGGGSVATALLDRSSFSDENVKEKQAAMNLQFRSASADSIFRGIVNEKSQRRKVGQNSFTRKRRGRARKVYDNKDFAAQVDCIPVCNTVDPVNRCSVKLRDQIYISPVCVCISFAVIPFICICENKLTKIILHFQSLAN